MTGFQRFPKFPSKTIHAGDKNNKTNNLTTEH